MTLRLCNPLRNSPLKSKGLAFSRAPRPPGCFGRVWKRPLTWPNSPVKLKTIWKSWASPANRGTSIHISHSHASKIPGPILHFVRSSNSRATLRLDYLSPLSSSFLRVNSPRAERIIARLRAFRIEQRNRRKKSEKTGGDLTSRFMAGFFTTRSPKCGSGSILDALSGAGFGGRGRTEAVEGGGQVGGNLFGHSAFNLTPFKHEHQLAIIKKCDRWRGG